MASLVNPAALTDTTDIAFPGARDPFHNLYWVSLKPMHGCNSDPHHSPSAHTDNLTILTDKLKKHMQKRHKLGSADTSGYPIHFYKIKAHSGIIGNVEADACARTAALTDTTDIALPDARDTLHNSYWLSSKTSHAQNNGMHRSPRFLHLIPHRPET
eukprot:1140438-Pelagomonas_calceolata.AAC.3